MQTHSKYISSHPHGFLPPRMATDWKKGGGEKGRFGKMDSRKKVLIFQPSSSALAIFLKISLDD